MYLEAKEKMEVLSRKKSKMHVTKWELLLILQMPAKDVKSIG